MLIKCLKFSNYYFWLLFLIEIIEFKFYKKVTNTKSSAQGIRSKWIFPFFLNIFEYAKLRACRAFDPFAPHVTCTYLPACFT